MALDSKDMTDSAQLLTGEVNAEFEVTEHYEQSVWKTTERIFSKKLRT